MTCRVFFCISDILNVSMLTMRPGHLIDRGAVYSTIKLSISSPMIR